MPGPSLQKMAGLLSDSDESAVRTFLSSAVEVDEGLGDYQDIVKNIDLATARVNTTDSNLPRNSLISHTPGPVQTTESASMVSSANYSPGQDHLGSLDKVYPRFPSDDARILALLVSNLSPVHEITLDMLHRGGSARKRWDEHGGIQAVEATQLGLSAELTSLLSDTTRLKTALDDLLGTVLVFSGHSYKQKEETASRICQSIAADETDFWKCQAFVACCGMIPWKYIESGNANTSLYLSHLRHTFPSCGTCLHLIPPSAHADIALTLLEAARFKPIAWKRSAVAEAEPIIRGINDASLSLCLAASQSVLLRIDGKLEESKRILDVAHKESTSPKNQRENARHGILALQRSLNRIQVDDLSQAALLLQAWRASSPEAPSLMEQVIALRMKILLGKICRYEGNFAEALAHLEEAFSLTRPLTDLFFDEDLRDSTCELADTLRELHQPEAAESHVRAELARIDQVNPGSVMNGRSLLEASLAESLFAQGRSEDAERMCLQVLETENVMRLSKIRANITLAKIHHISASRQAERYWSEAMSETVKFAPKNSRACRVILSSMQEIMTPSSDVEIQQQVKKQVDDLQHHGSSAGGMPYWLAGMRDWDIQLQSRGIRSRI